MRRVVLLLVAGGTVIVAGAAAITVGPSRRDNVREITLVARGMSFYLEGDGTPNPRLHAARGERVKIEVRNEAPGLVHALAIDAVEASTPLVDSGERTTLEFTAPDVRGDYDYYCPPHALMMRGTLTVTEPGAAIDLRP
jgi:hypothetical protein